MASGDSNPAWPAEIPDGNLTALRPSSLTLKPLGSRVKIAAGYLAAIFLPYTGAVLSLHSRPFHSTPLALSFASIAIITLLTGLGPGVIASLSSAIGFTYVVAPYEALPLHGPRVILHGSAIALLGLVVVYLCERQRVISERLQVAVDNLQHKTDALTEAQQASGSVAWTYDLKQGQIQWAEGGALIFGIPFESLTGLPLELVIEEDRLMVESAFKSAFASGTPFEIEFRSRLPNGELRWFESRGKPSARDRNLFRGVTLDISERKQSEMALVRSEKLAAIGRLSATIAHEMNNPLEAVTNLLFLCSGDASLSPEAREYLAGADQELARLSSIARHTLTFARARSTSGPAQTRVLLEGVVAMFRPRCAPRGGAIEIVHNPDLSVAASADELRQVLTNLVSNACDALDGPGGRIAIDVAADEEFATIEVRDNGTGISPQNMVHIFEPFFTTKPDVGTGIGLWVTRELVEKNGGDVQVRTTGLPAGFRTAFRVRLPLAND